MFKKEIRKTVMVALVLSTMVLSFTACSKNKTTDNAAQANASVATIQTGEVINNTQSQSNTQNTSSNTQNTSQSNTQNTSQGNTQNTSQSNTQNTSQNNTQENAQNNSASQAQNVNSNSNVTSKGYKIEVIDGATYIEGLLIANKTYALPSTYNPGDLTDEVKAAFSRMQQDAKKEGLNIYISSGFRSYNTQVSVYNRYVKQDGQALADTYSSRPGHSEHQTGLCFDLNSIDDSFGYTPESAWVDKHAHEYGFIVRFPNGKDAYTGYQYEPWHLRYVGTEWAEKIYSSGLSLEEYFGITSQYAD